MREKRISIRLDAGLHRRLAKEASLNGLSGSEITRQALEAYLAGRPARESCYDAFRRRRLIGMIKNAPPDLSTNRNYFRGFGRR